MKDKPGPPKALRKDHPDAQWTALLDRVKHLRGEEKLRHAHLLDVREDDQA